MKGEASSAQPLDIHLVLGGCSDQDISTFSSGNMCCGDQHRPLLLHGHRLRHDPQRQPRTSPWPQVVVRVTYNKLLLSTLKSPGPALFIKLNVFHVSFSPI